MINDVNIIFSFMISPDDNLNGKYVTKLNFDTGCNMATFDLAADTGAFYTLLRLHNFSKQDSIVRNVSSLCKYNPNVRRYFRRFTAANNGHIDTIMCYVSDAFINGVNIPRFYFALDYDINGGRLNLAGTDIWISTVSILNGRMFKIIDFNDEFYATYHKNIPSININELFNMAYNWR